MLQNSSIRLYFCPNLFNFCVKFENDIINLNIPIVDDSSQSKTLPKNVFDFQKQLFSCLSSTCAVHILYIWTQRILHCMIHNTDISCLGVGPLFYHAAMRTIHTHNMLLLSTMLQTLRIIFSFIGNITYHAMKSVNRILACQFAQQWFTTILVFNKILEWIRYLDLGFLLCSRNTSFLIVICNYSVLFLEEVKWREPESLLYIWHDIVLFSPNIAAGF